MTSYTTLWHELRDHYRRRRPVDLWTGVPLLTDEDVIALARRWSRALGDHAGDLGSAYASLERWWRDQRERLGRTTSLDRVRQFWRASFDLARELSYRLGRRGGRRVRNATADEAGLVRIKGMKDWEEMHMALKAYYAEHRGWDPANPTNKTKIPRTTFDDVRQLVAIFDIAAARARLDIFGVKGAVAEWKRVAAEVKERSADADPAAVYPHNRAFWKLSHRLVMAVQNGAEEPPDISFTDSLAKNFRNVPQTIGGAFSAAGGAIVGVGEDLAGGAADAFGDLVSSIGKPLLIGGAVVGAGVLAITLLGK